MTEPTTVCSEMPKCQGTGIAVKIGSKCRAADAVQKAETQLEHKAILGTVGSRQSRTWRLTRTQYDSASRKQRQRLAQEEVRASVKEERTPGRISGLRTSS